MAFWYVTVLWNPGEVVPGSVMVEGPVEVRDTPWVMPVWLYAPALAGCGAVGAVGVTGPAEGVDAPEGPPEPLVTVGMEFHMAFMTERNGVFVT